VIANFFDNLGNLGSYMQSGSNWAFFILALMAISGAIFMLSFTKVIHMVLSLALTFISIAGLYILLHAEFIAVVQVLIYSGAISILMIFGIMLTKHENEEIEPKRPVHNTLLVIGILGFLGILFYAVQKSVFPNSTSLNAGDDNTFEIGKLLFNVHVIPFELMSVLLTVAFIGAIVIAKKEDE